jgi:hypothetical protein
MKAANFQCFSTAMDEITGRNNIAQLAVFICRINMDFNITEELVALKPMKGTTEGANLYEEVEKMQQSLDIPIKKLAGLAFDVNVEAMPPEFQMEMTDL